jgi:hypothetical protein
MTCHREMALLLRFFLLSLVVAYAWRPQSISARQLGKLVAIGLLQAPLSAFAIDPALLEAYKTSGSTATQIGRATSDKSFDMSDVKRLQQAQDALDARDVPYIDLQTKGASYREFRVGKGDKVVTPGSTIFVEMTMRAKKLATAQQPGGVLYYSTLKDAGPSQQLAFTIGNGEVIPALEEAMLAEGGMKKGAVRRVEIPSIAVFAARKAGQLPVQKDADEIRLTKNLWKMEATMIVEVKVDKIIPPTSAET